MTNEIPEKKSCFRCGSPVSGIDAAGLCPRCLLAMNLRTRTLLTGPAPHETPPLPLTPEEVGRKFPQFEFLECLGRGGMGVVYKARQKALDRVVAVKILAGEWQEEPGFAERFAREARLLARLAHPNIVTVHDFGEAAGLYYLVMEYVDGVNLRDLLRDGRLEPQQALAIVSPVCEALQYAHGHGVVHRDIKPENLLLDREGRVKIADFGVAMLAGDAPDQSGTPAYMAPEQAARSKKADHRVDLYALGVVLYEMLTGERPGREIEGAAQRVHIDVRIDEIVLRALAVKPELRFQSAGEMATLVKTVAAAGPATGSAVAVEPRAHRPKMSRMALMGLAGSTLGIVSLCSFFYDGAPKKKAEPAAQVAQVTEEEEEIPEGAAEVYRILAKIRTIRIPEVNFRDATVEEMIDFLRKQARELDVKEPDPARKGINLVLRAATAEHPAKVGELRVKSLNLKNATLAEILRGICAETKLSYRVDDFAVTLIPQEESLAENRAEIERFDFSRKLNTVIPTVDFSNVTLKEAIDFLRKRSKELDVSEPDPAKRGLNLVVQVPEGEEEVRLKELRLRNVPLAEVLRYVCEAFRMQYITAKDSVTILPAAEVAEPPASVRLEESSPEQLT
ncbi:MAG: serine/threonine protein kinase, partial [Akkermansiaceae bacterium]|nr:serine/threonine protein kinase [Akkermansiaceae bacterium]